MPALKKYVDWRKVELDFRAGLLPLERIGNKHGISKGRISQVAKAENWSRDLKGRIATRTQEKVEQSEVKRSLNNEAKRYVKKKDELEVIEVMSDLRVDVLNRHK